MFWKPCALSLLVAAGSLVLIEFTKQTTNKKNRLRQERTSSDKPRDGKFF